MDLCHKVLKDGLLSHPYTTRLPVSLPPKAATLAMAVENSNIF
jgi:hypothetical protein